MADEKNPLERIVEAAVFAPLGIAAMLRDELDKLVARGHQEANMAKMMGQFAVKQARDDLEKRTEAGRRTSAVDAHAQAPRPTPATPATPPTPTAPAAPAAPQAPAVPVSGANSNGTAVTVHDAQNLAIPGYDSLSASQVVERLAGLNAEELEAIGSYESAGRGRRTILNRVAQLRDA